MPNPINIRQNECIVRFDRGNNEIELATRIRDSGNDFVTQPIAPVIIGKVEGENFISQNLVFPETGASDVFTFGFDLKAYDVAIEFKDPFYHSKCIQGIGSVTILDIKPQFSDYRPGDMLLKLPKDGNHPDGKGCKEVHTINLEAGNVEFRQSQDNNSLLLVSIQIENQNVNEQYKGIKLWEVM